MNALLKRGVDSAYAVVRYGRQEFIRAFGDELGERDATLAYAKAEQVHNAVLNIALNYLNSKVAPAIGGHSAPQIVDPEPAGPEPATAADVIAYPTLEGLFGEMDYCACDHCRSILSPAAYLVNLLQFIDLEPDAWATTLSDWKTEHGAPYPFADSDAWKAAGQPPDAETDLTPLEVLLSRRPDIQHLPLTCENTNTPLPCIDLVNETLEYYVTNNLLLADYTGHSTDGSASPEELLASPQFVSDGAYTTLAGTRFPPPLPFHQPLEHLRRYFARFEAPLSEVMEALRKSDDLERASVNEYAWRDILMEELRLSRAAYALLSDRTLTLQQLFGYAAATPDAEVLTDLSNARALTRRVGVTYEELLEILKTRFVNPSSALIPRLERLGVPFSTLKSLKDGAVANEAFNALLPPHIDPRQYGIDEGTVDANGRPNIALWVKDDANYANIMALITLANPTDEKDLCSFDKLELRYADPDTLNQPIRNFEFVRLIRFIRLWRTLGWSIEQTDKAIAALYLADQTPDDPDDAVNLERLDSGFLTLLPRLGVVRRLVNALRLNPTRDLLPLLACFAPIDTHGGASLYRQMFLSPALLKLDPAFADDGYGQFLADPAQPLVAHGETLRAAFLLTHDELGQVIAALGFDPNTPLTVENISAVLRGRRR